MNFAKSASNNVNMYTLTISGPIGIISKTVTAFNASNTVYDGFYMAHKQYYDHCLYFDTMDAYAARSA